MVNECGCARVTRDVLLLWQALELFLSMRLELLRSRLSKDGDIRGSMVQDSSLPGQLASTAIGVQDTVAQVPH